MLLPSLAILFGLALLVWSADRFIDGAAGTARLLGMPSLIIGMIVIGFGTSAPEMVVSAFAALEGNPGLALGNAYGSNIANVGLVLGTVAVLSPIAVKSRILRKEMPVLLGVTALSGYLIFDQQLDRIDAAILLALFVLLMVLSVMTGRQPATPEGPDELAAQYDAHEHPADDSLGRALLWLITGLVLLLVSSRILVWGAVTIAQQLGVSDLIIGLTVVAIGTSLPELAAAVAAVRKQEHDLALGNVIGSNIFNLLGVVGIAAGLAPFSVEWVVFWRDWGVTAAFTVALVVMGMGLRGPGRITRIEGVLLLSAYLAYLGWLTFDALGQMQGS